MIRSIKPLLVVCAAFWLLAPPAFAGAPAPAGPSVDVAGTQFARIGGFGRSRGIGGYRPRSRGFGYGRRGRSRGIFRSIIRALAIGYLLHLLFTTPGGNILLLFMILGIVMLVMRFRRRTSAFRY